MQSIRTPRAVVWYVTASLAATAVHPMLPAAVRPTWFFLVAFGTVPPIWLALRETPRADRVPGRLLLVAMVVISAGYLVAVLDAASDGTQHGTAELLITLGELAALGSALTVVRRRGRNDIGGLVDATLFAVALGGLLWTALIQPRLAADGATLERQVTVLVDILVLTGILGALGRLLVTAREPLPALRRYVYALVLSVIANVAVPLTGSFLTAGEPVWLQVTFLLMYTCLGAAPLDPSMQTLFSPGPAPVDGLTRGRLTFLGVALAVTPIIGGGRQLLGLPVDGLLLVVTTIAVVPLVMVRIGVLSAERARAEEALTYQATHDGLTGLPNRTELLNRLRSVLACADPRVVLLFCDLDGFKAINDRLGHLAGDELLVQVADRLAGCRGTGDTLARYGGDEFVMVCRGSASEATIRRAMARPFRVAGEDVAVGASVGVVTARRDTDAEALIRQADAAMYAAKRARVGTAIVGTREGVDRS